MIQSMFNQQENIYNIFNQLFEKKKIKVLIGTLFIWKRKKNQNRFINIIKKMEDIHIILTVS